MAEDGSGKSPYEDLLIAAGLFLLLIFAWFATGGAQKADLGGLFLMPPPPLGTGESYGPQEIVANEGGTGLIRDEVNRVAVEISAVEEELARLSAADASPYRNKVYIDSTYAASATNPAEEYVILRASDNNRERVIITGWRLESAISNDAGVIGGGIEVFVSGAINEGPIILEPGDEVIVTSGRSPVGTSFRTNRCTGYLSQFQAFTPSLSSRCPMPEQEALTSSQWRTLPQSCFDYLAGMGQCRIDLSIPAEIPDDCRNFITTYITYNGCVGLHRTEPGFREREWRVFLGRSSELWREKREIVKLLDATGKLVDITTY